VDDQHFALPFFIPAFLNPLLLHCFAEIRIMAASEPKYLLSYPSHYQTTPHINPYLLANQYGKLIIL
jgi:hypothetical protein